jgi:hypothetical protein
MGGLISRGSSNNSAKEFNTLAPNSDPSYINALFQMSLFYLSLKYATEFSINNDRFRATFSDAVNNIWQISVSKNKQIQGSKLHDAIKYWYICK